VSRGQWGGCITSCQLPYRLKTGGELPSPFDHDISGRIGRRSKNRR
jgi:hypothetical protein